MLKRKEIQMENRMINPLHVNNAPMVVVIRSDYYTNMDQRITYQAATERPAGSWLRDRFFQLVKHRTEKIQEVITALDSAISKIPT